MERKIAWGDKTHLGNQVGMPYDSPHEEAVVCHLCSYFHFRCSQVEVHLMVGTWDGSEVEVSHPVQLQLESQSWLQMPVDPIFFKLEAPSTYRKERM